MIVISCLLCKNIHAQQNPIVGIEVKPIIPSELFNNSSFKNGAGNVVFNTAPNLGFNFGMVIRKSIYKGISLESGITYTQRKYSMTATDSSGFSTGDTFRFISYEIPILALIYIRTAENDYIDGAFGFSADFFVSDVGKSNTNLTMLTRPKYWVLPALSAAIGYEHRTKKSGYFYIGGSYHRMLANMAYTKLDFTHDLKVQSITIPLNGHYFALDFKYFFPVNNAYDPEYEKEY